MYPRISRYILCLFIYIVWSKMIFNREKRTNQLMDTEYFEPKFYVFT